MKNFRVWAEGDEDDVRTVKAVDPEHAAEIWAEHDDCYSADYLIVSGRFEPVVVVVAEDGSRARFCVSGETVAKYSARALTEGEKP